MRVLYGFWVLRFLVLDSGSWFWVSGSPALNLEPGTMEPGAKNPEAKTRNPERSRMELIERPRFAVWGGRMDLRKQVEPLGSCALGFLTPRHAHHAALRFSWVKRWPKRASENHHAQSRELSFRKDLIPLGRREATSNDTGEVRGVRRVREV